MATMDSFFTRRNIGRLLLLIFSLAGVAVGILVSFAVLFFFIGGSEMIVDVWEGNIGLNGYKWHCVGAIVVGVLTGAYVGEYLWQATMKITKFRMHNERDR